MFDVNQITSTLRGMGDRALQQYAAMNKGDPYILSLAVSESNQRKKLRSAAQNRNVAPQPKVADAAIAGMAEAAPVDAMGNVTGMASGGLPEDQGIARIPAPNIKHLADGGIAGYGDDEEGMATGGMGGMFNFAQQTEPVVRMSGGGMPGYKNGGLTDKQEFAAQYKDIAEKVGKELGVDPGILISQWGMETGWGKKQIGQFNLGNIKDVTGKGPKAYDKMEKSRDSYKTYDSPDAFAADYASLIKRNFPKAVGAGSDIGAFSAGLQAGEKGAYATDPNYRKSLANTYKSVTDLLPIGTAQAETVPTTAPDYKGQKAQDTDQSSGSGITSLAGLSGAAMGAADKMRQLYNTHTPLTRTGSMLRNLRPTSQLGIAAEGAGTAAAVPGIVGLGGGVLTAGVTNALSNATPEQLSQMEGFGADPSGTSFGAAILHPENRKPENAPKMSSGEQIANAASFLPKFITQHPDIDRMREANKAKEEKAASKDDPLNRVPVSPDEFGSAVGIPDALPDLNKKQMDNLAEKAKEATPVEARKGLTNDDYLMMGLSLLANKSPNLGTAIGEAGVATLGAKKEREKAEREEAKLKGTEELQKAQAKYYGSYADAIERGAKEKNEQFQAEQLVQKHMESWEKNNKIANIQDPMARLQEENRARQQIYANLGLKPIMAGQAAPAGAGDFKIVGVR